MATIITVLSFAWILETIALAGGEPGTRFVRALEPWLWWLYQALMAVTLWVTVTNGWRYLRAHWHLFTADS